MRVKRLLISGFILSIVTACAVHAYPTERATCGDCHGPTSGRFEIVSEDTVLDLGNQNGPLKTFVVVPGTTKRLSVNVLNDAGTGYLVVSGLERGGQQNSSSNFLDYNPDSAWTEQGLSFAPYYTKLVASTGPDGFELTVNEGTPDDVYHLTFGMAGTGGGRWSQAEQFYVQVISAPTIEALVVLSPNGGQTLNADDTYTITWQGGAGTDVIEIDYSTDNGSNWTQIATGLANSGGYEWLVPSINTTQAFVRVSSAGDTDMSDGAFTIVWIPPSPTVSGSIASTDAPMAGVSVVADNGGGSTVTDASGSYSLTVPYGWTGIVTPSLAGYTFDPAARTYTNVTGDLSGQDYTGVVIPPSSLTISGTITDLDSGLFMAGVSVVADNGGGSTVTDASGSYSLTVPYGWTGVVTPSLAGYTFDPATRTSTNVTADLSGEDYTGVVIPPSSLTISGTITALDSGLLMAGVSVVADNGGGSTVTDASGSYSLTVPYDWAGTITPSKAGYTFDPESMSYNNVTDDQTGEDYLGVSTSPGSPTISGSIVTAEAAPIAGVSVVADNGGGSTVTDASGTYSLTVPYGWTGVVTPSLAGYTFDPATRTYANVTADLSGEDYTGVVIPNGDIIIDNGDPGTSSIGEWSSVTGEYAYGQDALHSKSKDAMYMFWAPITGTYQISMWWMNQNPLEPSQDSGAERRKTPPGQANRRGALGLSLVEVFDGDEIIDIMVVDQSLNGGQWNSIGTYDFTSEASVAIISISNRNSSCADAVQFAELDATGGGTDTDDDGGPIDGDHTDDESDDEREEHDD